MKADGQLITEVVYDKIYSVNCGYVLVKGDKHTLIDKDGEVIFEKPTAFSASCTGNYYSLSFDDEKILIDKEGKEISRAPVSYTHLTLPTTPYV